MWHYIMENILELINLKIKKYKLFKKLNIFLATLFSLIGTVSIVSLLMFLNMYCSVGYFACIILSVLLPQLYSFVIKEMVLIKVDAKMNNIYLDIVRMINDVETKNKLELDINNDDIKQRFDSLSSSKQLELLRYVKNDLKYVDRSELDKLCLSSKSVIEASNNMVVSLESGYSRSRNIREEFTKKH